MMAFFHQRDKSASHAVFETRLHDKESHEQAQAFNTIWAALVQVKGSRNIEKTITNLVETRDITASGATLST